MNDEAIKILHMLWSETEYPEGKRVQHKLFWRRLLTILEGRPYEPQAKFWFAAWQEGYADGSIITKSSALEEHPFIFANRWLKTHEHIRFLTLLSYRAISPEEYEIAKEHGPI